MAAVGELPIFMRIGNSEEHRIGTFHIIVDQQGEVTTTLGGHDLAQLLRQAADEIDSAQGT
jgi:hypothetical protein